MNKNIFFCLLVCLACHMAVNAQKIQRCATYAVNNSFESSHLLYKKQREVLKRSADTWLSANKNRTGKKDSIFIPVVVHILWNKTRENISDSQVLSQIKVLNEDFNGLNADTINTPGYFKERRGKTNFYFRLAKQDPDGLPTTGINRRYTYIDTGFGLDARIYYTSLGGQDPWDPRFYVNLYVCRLAKSTNTFAVTYFPGGSLRRDGIMCDYRYFGTVGITTPPYNLGRTVTHEMGHYFNLDHTWGPTDITGLPDCADDDHVWDTPTQTVANFGCPVFPQPSCLIDTSDAFMDYMDYSDDGCMNLFTQGQSDRMLAAYYVMTPNLQYSKALQNPLVANNDIGVKAILSPANNTYTCAGFVKPKIVIRNYGKSLLTSFTVLYGVTESGLVSKTFNNLSVSSYTNDTVELDKIYFNKAGSLHLTFSTANPNGFKDENVVNDKMEIVLNNNTVALQKLPIAETFTSLKFPPAGWSILNPDELFTWTPTTGSQLSGYAPSVMMDNIESFKKGSVDELLLPALDFSGQSKPILGFDRAFALYKYGRPVSDTLQILVSKNCGITWRMVFNKGGKELSTAQNGRYGYLSPDSLNEWKREFIDLSDFANEPNVLVSFKNICGMENLLYLDNICVKNVPRNNVKSATSGNQLFSNTSCTDLTVFRGEAINIIGIKNADFTSIKSVQVFNALGQSIPSYMQAGKIVLPANTIAGIYYVQLFLQEGICRKKILVQ